MSTSKTYYRIFIGCLLTSIVLSTSAQEQMTKPPVDYVDPLMGTTFSRWMLFPGVSMPFGMVKLSPDNQRKGWKAGYEYKIHNIAGFSHLHSWTMGGLLTMPAVGPLKIDPGTETDPDLGYRSRFSHEREIAQAGYYSVFLDDYGIRAELTTTTRAGFQRYTFPASKEARILIDLKIPTEYSYEIFEGRITKVSDTEIQGYTVQQSLRGANYNEFTLHWVMRFSKPFTSFNGWKREEIILNTDDIWLIFGDEEIGAFVTFETGEGEQILVQSGISLVSIEQARLNLKSELDPFNWDFEAVKSYNRNTWNQLLGTIAVDGGSQTDFKKFYTNMYRAYASRTIWSDVNGKYVDMYEKVQQLEDPGSPVYGCDAFWNTFWNLNQLWTLQHPDIANKWVRSLIEINDQGGWLPKGPTGIEYSGIMVAEHEISLMVSAYQKGIRNYDVEKSYAAMRHSQMEQGIPHPGGGWAGNRDLAVYMKYGYVPNEFGPVSNTLEYAYDDWCVAQMARALGKESDYKTFMKRAFNYKNVFYPEVGYVWMKNADGSWVENFTPYGHSVFLGPGFVEGNAWQYTWFMPHDQAGLLKLLGKEKYITRLESGFDQSLPHRFNSEHLDENGLIGVGILPINHGNQPNMQAAYLFNHAGAPWLTQKWVRAIMEGFYGDGIDAWPGDEDQGQMGAWYVMSAMGLFEMDGGASVDPIYEIGSPIFEKITIQLDTHYYSGTSFTILAKNNSAENKYIQSAKLNGKPLTKPWFYHRELVQGGNLELVMGPEPNKFWGSRTEDAPPSMSNQLTQAEIDTIMAYDKFLEDLDAWNRAVKAYYYHRKEHFESLPDTPHEIIFLGNSITDNCEWAELFENPNIKNRGIGGDDTDGILDRLTEVTRSHPDQIFLMIGTNDLAYGKSVEHILTNYRKIIGQIRRESPKTELFIQSVLPVEDALHIARPTDSIMAINAALAEMAREYGPTYIDLFPVFARDDNRINMDYSIDGLHLNAAGYLKWKEVVKPCLRKESDRHAAADSVYIDTHFTRFFARDCCGVTGSDGFYSIPLPDGRVIWIFGDSFLGTVNPDGTRERRTPVFIRNAFGVQEGDSLRSLYQVMDGWESSFVIPPDAIRGETFSEDSLWYWPGDGLVEDGKLKVFMSSFYQADTGNWGFRWTGTSLATFSLPDILLERIDPVSYSGEKEIHWGHAICDEAPEYTYVYGAENETKYPYAARAPKGTILAPWEFWDGTGWVTDAKKAQPMLEFRGSEQFSVFRLDDRYVLLTGGGPFPFTSLYVSTSDNPFTDWSVPKKLTDLLPLHPGSNLFAYNPVAHPQFTENGELLVSYCVNSFDLNDLFLDATSYRPVFIRLPVRMIP